MLANTAYLGLGSNLGDRRDYLRRAVALLNDSAQCEVTAASSLYVTEPLGYTDQPEFVNAVVEISTALAPQGLLELCSSVEQTLGRVRTIRWGPRVIDIDILIYSGVCVDDKDLVVPHPRMMERAFVLVPLAEIAPGLVLPGGLTAAEAAQRVDRSGIRTVMDNTWSRL